MTIKHSNNFSTTLAGDITDVATTMTLASGTGLPVLTGGDTCKLTLDDGVNPVEIVEVSSITGATINTMVRAQESTAGFAWTTGTVVELRLTAETVDDKADRSEIPTTTDDLAEGSTNKYTSAADISKLAGIESGAEVNDVDSVNGLTGVVSLDQDDIPDGTTNKAYTATEQSKLAGIESAADVTDLANVTSALDTLSTTKATPVSGDYVYIQDSAASYVTKKVLFSAFGGGGGSQTPWTADIDTAGFVLTNASNADGVEIEGTGAGTFLTQDTLTIKNATGNSTATNILIYEGPTNGSNYVNVNAPDSLSGNVNFTLPNSNGTNTYVLQTDGSGNTSWVAPGGSYTDEQAQDAVGAMIDSSLVYVDATPLLQRAALTGDVTASAGSNTTVIATPSAAAVAGDDKLLFKDTSASNVMASATVGSLRGRTSTTTAAGTTTLTSASTTLQIFTGTSTQNCDMPAVSTLTLGHRYEIINDSTGVVTVRSSGSNSIQAMAAGSRLVLISNATTGTSAAVWTIIEYSLKSAVYTGTAGEIDLTGLAFGIVDNPLIPGNEKITIPGGSTFSRPASPTNWDFRGNSSTGGLEYYLSGVWYNVFNDFAGPLSRANGGTGNSITPAFAAGRTSTQSVTNNTYVKVQLSQEISDNNNNYDPTTNFRFTPTVAGNYIVTGNIDFTTATDQMILITTIYKNGAAVSYNVGRASGAGEQGNAATAIVAMNGSTDYIELYCYQGSAGSLTLAANACFFSAALLV